MCAAHQQFRYIQGLEAGVDPCQQFLYRSQFHLQRPCRLCGNAEPRPQFLLAFLRLWYRMMKFDGAAE